VNALTWAKGLAAAVVSAVSTTILASGISSGSGTPLNWHQIGSIAASSALVGACLYLKQSPIPDEDEGPSVDVVRLPPKP
jgi:hypothetical protein